MLKNILRVNKKKSSDHIIIRKTKFILYVIISLIIFFLCIQFGYILGIINIPITYETGSTSVYIVFLVASILFIIMIWYFLIGLLVSYFYSITILTSNKMISIRFGINFVEKIRTIELNKIISISSSQKGIIQTFCNYGNVTLRNANEMNIVLEQVPKPKYVSDLIQKIKSGSH